MTIGVRRISITVSSGFAVVFGLFQILFFNNFPALNHTGAAVRTVVPAFFAARAAIGAFCVILDFGPGNLLFICSAAGRTSSESRTSGNPADKLHDSHYGQHKENDQHDEAADHSVQFIVIVRTAASGLGAAISALTVDRKCEGVIGISYRNGVTAAR